jgi:hypothetical protein
MTYRDFVRVVERQQVLKEYQGTSPYDFLFFVFLLKKSSRLDCTRFTLSKSIDDMLEACQMSLTLFLIRDFRELKCHSGRAYSLQAIQ